MLRIVSVREQPSKHKKDNRHDKDPCKLKNQSDTHAFLPSPLNTEAQRHRAASTPLDLGQSSSSHLCASVSLCLNISVHDTFISSDKRFLAKVYEQTKMQFHQPQISQRLNSENGIVFLHRFTFDNNSVFHQNVNSKRISYLNALVGYWDKDFFLDFKISKF